MKETGNAMKGRLLGLFCALSVLLLLGASCPKKSGPIDNSGSNLNPGKSLFSDAESLYQAGDYEGARAKYQEVVEQYPGTDWSRESQLRIGQCYFSEGKDEEALSRFRQYVNNNPGDPDVATAQDYIIRILDDQIRKAQAEYQETVAGLNQQNFRLETLNNYLRRSVDSETIYLELDLEFNRLFIKMGTQTLYDFPVVTGKGKTRLKATGKLVDFNTPKGIRQVESIEKDPMWYRPDWVWLEHGETVPENLTMEDRAVPYVLGPYKVSIGEGFYFHGTKAGTIRPGKFSHGCIRLNNKDLIQLVHMVEVGTMVYIY